MKKFIPLLLVTSYLFCGCGSSTEETSTETTTTTPLETSTETTTTTTLETSTETTTTTPLEISTKKETFNVEVEAKMTKNNGIPSFTINTNLPNETELMLTLDNKVNGYCGQTKVIIQDGTATSEEFSSNGNPLSGEYTLTVSMSLPPLQTDNVRATIGEKGEYITGKYVVNDEITGSNYISADFEFTI